MSWDFSPSVSAAKAQSSIHQDVPHTDVMESRSCTELRNSNACLSMKLLLKGGMRWHVLVLLL